jgi:hypothetical protein
MDTFTLSSDGHNSQESEIEIKECLRENGQGGEQCNWEDGVGREESDGETEIVYSGEEKGNDADKATSECSVALLAFNNMSRLVSLFLIFFCLDLSCLVFLPASLLHTPMSLSNRLICRFSLSILIIFCIVSHEATSSLLICSPLFCLEEESPLAKRLSEYKRRKEAQKEEDEGLDLICKRYVPFMAQSMPHFPASQIGWILPHSSTLPMSRFPHEFSITTLHLLIPLHPLLFPFH